MEEVEQQEWARRETDGRESDSAPVEPSSNQQRGCWLGDSIHVEFKTLAHTQQTQPDTLELRLRRALKPPVTAILDKIGLFSKGQRREARRRRARLKWERLRGLKEPTRMCRSLLTLMWTLLQDPQGSQTDGQLWTANQHRCWFHFLLYNRRQETFSLLVEECHSV